MKAAISHTPHIALRRKWFATSTALVLAAAVLAIGLLAQTPAPASAQAAPVTQCNDDTASNVGGQGIRCTVTIVNYVTGTGAIDASTPSTVTVTRCTGAAGPIASGAGTCTTTTTTSAAPVTLVQQCNGSGNGGGGVVICEVIVTNYFSSSPAAALTPAKVYQCIGSVITGPGAPGTCTPVNTPGITSVTAATVGQCNGSGNGGTSVRFVCTVAAGSTTTSTLVVNVDQCNGSANGGGALTECTARVTNNVVAAPPPEVEIIVPVVPPPAAPVPEIVPVPVAPGVVPVAPPGAIVVPPVVVPPGVAEVVIPPVVVPPGIVRVLVPVVVPPGVVPVIVPQVLPTPTPPATGNAGLADRGDGTSQALVWLLGVATVGLVLAGRRLASRRHGR